MTNTAAQDLKSIVHYIRYDLREPGTAANLYRAIKEEIQSLSCMPMRNPLWDDEPWHGIGVRKLIANHYLVLYLVDQEQDTVQIARIIYAGQDIAGQLQHTDWEKLS